MRFSSDSYTVNENDAALLTLIITNRVDSSNITVNISSMDETATGN